MTELQEFAKQLSGEWTAFDDMIVRAEKEAKKKGIVIVYGASDDLCELRGAIYDEFDCYNGGTAYITQDGQITKIKPNNACKSITAYWCSNDDGWCWTYDVDFPHEVFELYDSGEKYCRGFVFYLNGAQTEMVEQEEKDNEELRIKIAGILQSQGFDNGGYAPLEIGLITALNIADALIAAGIGDISSEIAARELAETALQIASLKIATMIDEDTPACEICENKQSCNLTVGCCSKYMKKCCIEQAEEELAQEERK